MSVSVKTEDNGIRVHDMKDGQLAVVISDQYSGRVVQRYNDYLISVGMGSGSSWTTIFVSGSAMRVRLLEVGEMIEVKSN